MGTQVQVYWGCSRLTPMVMQIVMGTWSITHQLGSCAHLRKILIVIDEQTFSPFNGRLTHLQQFKSDKFEKLQIVECSYSFSLPQLQLPQMLPGLLSKEANGHWDLQQNTPPSWYSNANWLLCISNLCLIFGVSKLKGFSRTDRGAWRIQQAKPRTCLCSWGWPKDSLPR